MAQEQADVRRFESRRDLKVCDSCTALGACKIGVHDLRMTPDGGVRGRFLVPENSRGHAVAHGGWIAWVFDEALGLLPQGHGEWAVTTELSVQYARPVPVGADVTVRAWLADAAGSNRHLRGDLRLTGPDLLLASASGEWAVINDVAHHYKRALAWSARVLEGL